MTFGEGWISTDERARRIVEAEQHVVRRQHARSGGGHLDRQRQSVEAPAELLDGRQVVELRRTGPGGPLDEQLHGSLRSSIGVDVPVPGQWPES